MANLSLGAIEAVLKGKNSGDAAALAQEIFDILQSGVEAEADRKALTSQEYDRMKESIEALMATETTRRENLELQLDLDGEKKLMEDQAIKRMKKELKLMLLSEKASKKSILALKGDIEARQEDNDKLADSIRIKEQLATANKRVSKGIKKAIGYNEKYAETFVGSTIDMAIMFNTSEAGWNEVKKSFMNAEFAAGMLFNAMEKIGESITILIASAMAQATAMDTQQVGFRKATGLGKEYDQMMMDTYQANKLNGVSIEENAEAMGNLAKGMSDFTMLGTQQKKMLIDTAGILQENGVASATFAANTQIMNKGLSMGAEDAAQFNTTMVAMAKDIGMAPQELADGFGELAGTMTALSGGSEAAQTAMRGLSATSKATGIAMGRIVDITSQFDTFEGASESVGALNAMLGGDFINAMDVMAAEDPAERFGMMQQALDDAGKSFDDMAYYEKKAIAESMGLKDTNELAMLMSGNMDQLAGDFGKTSDEIMAMEKSARANQSVQESYAQLLAEMAPIVQGMIDGARAVVEVLQFLGPLLPYVGAMLLVLGAGVTAAYVQMRFFVITGNAANLTMGQMGAAALSTGKAFMLGFGVFVLVTIIIYKLYKSFGPLGGGMALLGLAAIALGAAIYFGLVTSTGGIYLVISGIIFAIAGLVGIFWGLATMIYDNLVPILKVLGVVLMFAVLGPLALIPLAAMAIYKNFDKLKSMFVKFGTAIKEGVTDKFLALKDIMMAIPRAFKKMKNVIGNFGAAAAAKMGIPGFETGGTTPGGPVMVGEGGPEILVPPAGSAVLPNPILSALGNIINPLGIGGGGGKAQEVNLHVTLELEGRELSKYIKKVTLPMMNPVSGEG